MGSIPRTFLSSLIIIFIFYTSPILIDIAKQNDQEFQNKSKAVLAYTLNSETGNIGNDSGILNEKDLLVDIFSLNDLETDTV